MKFLNHCFLGFVFMITSLKAADKLDIDDIKEELLTFRSKIRTMASQDSLPKPLCDKYKAITETVDRKMNLIEGFQKNPGTRLANTYIEDLLEAYLDGKREYIVAVSKQISLQSIVTNPALFSLLDFQNYSLSAKLIKYFYQQTPLEDLTGKTKAYLSISKTLWTYIQEEQEISRPTIGELWEEASSFVKYSKYNILPKNIFPPLKNDNAKNCLSF